MILEGRSADDGVEPVDEMPPNVWLTAVHFDVAYAAAAPALDAVRTALAITDPADNRVTAAAVISWDRDDRRPRLQPVDIPGSLEPGLMEFLFATTYLVPLVAAAMQLPPRENLQPLHAAGIDRTFLNRLRDHLSPGQWMVLMLASPEQLDDVAANISTRPPPFQYGTRLNAVQVAAFRTLFATDTAPSRAPS